MGMKKIKTFDEYIKEHSDYRNVTGYGSMGSPDPQNAGPSFNKGPDAATYNRPEVIGVERDYIEDPYFGDRRQNNKVRIKKDKRIVKLRKDKTKYLRSLDKDTRKGLFEQINREHGGIKEI